MSISSQERISARVCLSRGDRGRVLLPFPAHQECEAIVAGSLIFSGSDLPVTGDWTEGRLVEPHLFLIERIQPRRTRIARRAAGKRSDAQVLAANVDLALIVGGLDGDFNVRRIERYLALCYEGGVEPVIVLNKTDLCTDLGTRLEQTREVAGNCRILTISALRGDGCGAIRELFRDQTTGVLLGSSGAGKSSLLNQIAGEQRHSTAAVRDSDSRGRHTTSDRELIVLREGGCLIDTPGLREIQLLVSEESIESVFEEITSLSTQCRFADCTHSQEPDCAVRNAVAPDRLASYHKLRNESARLTDPLTEKQRWRSIHKAVKRLYRDRERRE